MTTGLYSSNTAEWATPKDFFSRLDAEFHFNLDPCATPSNTKCTHFYSVDTDGLSQDWGGARVFCNPPYGRVIASWVRKCSEEAAKGALVVALLPARTDTAWFHDYIYHKAREIRFIRGRLHFNESKTAAPFPSMVVIF